MSKGMKKIIFLSGVLFLYAGVCFSAQDRFGSERPAVWRSSATSSVDQNVSISSGVIILHGVRINTPGTASILEIFDGSVSSQTAKRITSVIDTTGKHFPDYDVIYSSGIIYNNLGSPPASIDILWDWFLTTHPR